MADFACGDLSIVMMVERAFVGDAEVLAGILTLPVGRRSAYLDPDIA